MMSLAGRVYIQNAFEDGSTPYRAGFINGLVTCAA